MRCYLIDSLDFYQDRNTEVEVKSTIKHSDTQSNYLGMGKGTGCHSQWIAVLPLRCQYEVIWAQHLPLNQTHRTCSLSNRCKAHPSVKQNTVRACVWSSTELPSFLQMHNEANRSWGRRNPGSTGEENVFLLWLEFGWLSDENSVAYTLRVSETSGDQVMRIFISDTLRNQSISP